jgi:hypothetical protein
MTCLGQMSANFVAEVAMRPMVRFKNNRPLKTIAVQVPAQSPLWIKTHN